MLRMRWFVWVIALSTLGCSIWESPGRLIPRRQAYSQEALREDLADFSGQFSSMVAGTADAISQQTDDRRVRRRALIWKVQAIPLVQEAALEPNPQEAFVSVLTLMVMLRQYLVDGEGKAALGPGQSLAVEATRELESDLVKIGRNFLKAGDLERVREEVEEFARLRPMTGDFAVQRIRRALDDVEETGVFKQVVDVPLSPFRALAGAGDTPGAIREFNLIAREFARTAERLPERVRWQVELLLYDVEALDPLGDSLSQLRSLVQTGEQLADAADRLPADVRSLLEDSGETLAQLDRTLQSASGLTEDLRATAEYVEAAGTSWAALMDRGGESKAEPGRPFDIREYQATAREIATAARELQSLAAELRAPQEGRASGAAASFAETLDLATERARGLIDRAAWRLFQLTVAGFLLLLVYRLIGSRLWRQTK